MLRCINWNNVSFRSINWARVKKILLLELQSTLKVNETVELLQSFEQKI